MLITRRSADNDYMPLYWDIPGGTVESGERVEEALVREVKEEVSLDIKIGHILYVHTNLGGLPDRQTFQMIFSCEWVAGEIKLDPQEHSEHRWIFEGELEQFQMIEFLGKYHAWASKRI
jgi:8-oxo-dGTP diphosphatase